jgi:peptidoglycan-associated lipoprotein
VLWKPGQGTATDGATLPTAIADERIKKDFGSAISAQPKLPVRFLLYFGDGAKLTSLSEAMLPKILAEAATRPGVALSVIGHTDTLNTESYNEQLALKRAATVALMLKEKGLKANSVTVESHGKRNLLVPTPDNTFEPKNRRVEVSIR